MKKRITDPVTVTLTAEQAMTTLNGLKYDETELQSSEWNRKISAIRHRLHVGLGELEANNESEEDNGDNN